MRIGYAQLKRFIVFKVIPKKEEIFYFLQSKY